MTITLPWWLLPIGFVVAGFVCAAIFGRRRGDYDMVSPLICLACAAIGIAAAVAFLIGRFAWR